MRTESKKKSEFREILNLLSTIISWTIFTLLIIIAILLVYYFIAVKIYVSKGSGHEPKFSLYTIITGSMVPNINVYDVVVDVKVDKPEDIKINDVITFNSSLPGVRGGTVTHRVIAISKDASGKYHFRTKGDHNLVDDGVDIEFNDIIGKVVLKIPGLGNVQRFIMSKTGWLLCVLLPALYVIIKDILKIIKLKSEGSNNKFTRFLNRPLITFKKRKLLTYTPKEESITTNKSLSDSNSNLKEVDEFITNEVKEDVCNNLNEIKDESTDTNSEINNILFYANDDDDDFDLPKLK